MNNNNSKSINNAYSGVPLPSEASAIDLAPTVEVTAINIDSDSEPNTATPTSEENSIRINMEGTNSSSNARLPSSRNLLLLFNEARSQLGRQASYPGTSTQQQRTTEIPLSDRRGTEASQMLFDRDTLPHSPNSHARHVRSWRMNLNDVLSFSSTPTTEALRSFITHSGNFRYTPLSTNENAVQAGENIHVMLNQGSGAPPASVSAEYRMAARSNSLSGEHTTQHGASAAGGADASLATETTSPPMISLDDLVSMQTRQTNGNVPTRHPNNNNNLNSIRNNAPQATNGGPDIDEDNNVISDIFVKLLSHFVRYLPFICILFVKFIHDHLLGILDLLLLHGIMYQINKSLREQIAKFSQKSYGILLRDFSLVAFVVAYRFVLASSAPDPFGLLIAPPAESITIEVSSVLKSNFVTTATSGEQQSSAVEVLNNYLSQVTAKTKQSATPTLDPLGNAVTITKAISLGVLLYYVAVNDLIVKLITILVKISITMMPTRIIRHKPRARMFVLVEYLSQCYRALAPVRQWLMFLFESYTGLEVISGVLFSSFYMGAKGFEFVERGKSLRKSLINFLRNMDYERKPTNDELEAAGSLCPICHDAYNTPVVLECGHIFCDDCVSTWFKREQTCPMCRAKVSDDPTWQDGSTTFFYQLC